MELTTTDNKFDYSLVPVETREKVKTKTVEINVKFRQTARGIVEIGNELIQIKKDLGHGNWMQWVESEFDGSIDTAQRFMSAARKNSKTADLLNLNCNPTATYAISEKSTSNDIIEAALEYQETGGDVTEKWVKEAKDLEEEVTRLKEENTNLKKDGTPVEPNLDNLIPEVKAMLDEKRIMPALGRLISTMTPEGQFIWVMHANNVLSLENQLNETKSELKKKEEEFDSQIETIVLLREENERLQADGTPVKPNLENLIPEIKEILDGKQIKATTAKMISTMSDEGQLVWFQMFDYQTKLKDQIEKHEESIKERENKIEELKNTPNLPDDVKDEITTMKTTLEKNREALDKLKEERDLFETQRNGYIKDLEKANKELKSLDYKRRETDTLTALDDANKQITKAITLFSDNRGNMSGLTQTILLTAKSMQRKLDVFFEQESSQIIDIDMEG